ncbi:MAG: hypothetical protein JNM69_04230 [Archangium sp.]|nr:hypothetical protein [Archangium sp.]
MRRLLVLLLGACGGVTVTNRDAGTEGPLFLGGLGGAGGGGSAAGEPVAGGNAGGVATGGGASGVDAGSPREASTGFENPRFELPDAGDAGAMTCAWLDGDNCWKRQVDALVQCGLPIGAVGQFTADGRQCVFDGGLTMTFSSEVPEVRDGGTFWVAAFRLSTSTNASCFETAYALGRARFSAGATRVWSHNTSLFAYEIVCPDLSVFDNVPEHGACPDFGLRYLGGRVPGHDLACDATECRVTFNGAREGKRIAARCVR